VQEYVWSNAKDRKLRDDRGIGFLDIVDAIAAGGLLDVLEHPNAARYSGQRIFVVRHTGYVYLVPFVENETELVLKTIIPSRKATRDYGGDR
jgi:hypothetical protein